MNSSDGGSDQHPDDANTGRDVPTSGPRATYPVEQSSTSRRRWFLVSASVVVLAGVALSVFAYIKFATPDVSGEGTGYEILDSNTVAVQYTVTRSDPSRPAACIVRGRSRDGDESGRREVLIPPSAQKQVGVRTEVATSAPPVIGEVFGCTTSVPPYLHAVPS